MQKIKTDKGACDKADICPSANDRCKQYVFSETMICAPSKRYMYCHGWKAMLGLVFDKRLGVHISPEMRETLLKRAGITIPRPRTEIYRGMS